MDAVTVWPAWAPVASPVRLKSVPIVSKVLTVKLTTWAALGLGALRVKVTWPGCWTPVGSVGSCTATGTVATTLTSMLSLAFSIPVTMASCATISRHSATAFAGWRLKRATRYRGVFIGPCRGC